MSETDPVLTELAVACGIGDFYWDARGERHRPPEATLRHLLHAMGVLPARDADRAAVESALQAERDAPWQRTLPPVRVLPGAAAHGIEMVVADDALHLALRWQLRDEAGGTIEGTVTPAEAAQAGAHGDAERASHGRRGGQAVQARWLALPTLAEGYHTLTLSRLDGTSLPQAQARLIVSPARCHDVPDARAWGVCVQLYAQRSARNHGVGDFVDLANLGREFAALGADVIGINPLHALFGHEPEQASPYSPSSRLFLNPQYIALDAVPGFAALDAAHRPSPESVRPLRAAGFVDWSAAAALSASTLEALYAHALATRSSSLQDFARWRERAGEPLELFALFEALRERNAASQTQTTCAWWDWPDGLDRPDSAACRRAREELAERISFHAWLQWQAASQLQQAARDAADAGMRLGLYQDLAVGTAAGGSDAWAAQEAYLRGVGVGAPPDDFSANGQGWGLPPLNPRALREQGYEPFAQMLRANMRTAGALRIDHVMGLARLFWIPDGQSPADGAYVTYPLDDMLAVLALESRRAGCVVIGEDLGTVPEGFRERLAEAGVLSYKLMYFEKNYAGDQGFIAPRDYAATSLVGANTHDLPTLRGWWQASDLALREELGLMPSVQFLAGQRAERDADKRRLLSTMHHVGALPDGIDPEHPERVEMDEALVAAVHGFLAMSPSRMLVVNLEDMVGQVQQMNLPGTDRDVYPNWRRRLEVPLERIGCHPGVTAVAEAIDRHR